MGAEESVIFWIVKGEDESGKQIRRSDYAFGEIPIEDIMYLARALMYDHGIVKGRVYVFKKIAEEDIDLTGELKK